VHGRSRSVGFGITHLEGGETAQPSRPAAPGPRRVARPGVALVVGLVLLAINLRLSVAGLPPVLPDLGAQLSLSPAVLSALAAAPVVCFGLFSFCAAPLRSRLGEEATLLGALACILVGLVLRAVAPAVLLFPGTVLACAGIAVANVLSPSLIKRRGAGHVSGLLSIYSVSLMSGATVAGAIVVPIYRAAGDSLVVALGIWTLPAALALVAWVPQLGRPAKGVARPAVEAGRVGILALRRSPIAWQVTLFMGVQSISYYALLSWLPTLLRGRGVHPVEAGLLLGAFSIANVVTGTAAPLLARRIGLRPVIAVAMVWFVVGLFGAVAAPVGSALLWVVLLGLSQGFLLPVALLLMMVRAADGATSAALSGMAQGVGYLLAAGGTFAVGVVHAATGSWAVPIAVLVVDAAAGLLIGWGATRDRIVDGHAAQSGVPLEQPTPR
jgi:MFS transporter, CP family, cyanate transporter